MSFKMAQAHLVGQFTDDEDEDLGTFVVNQAQHEKNLTLYDNGMQGIDSYIEPDALHYYPDSQEVPVPDERAETDDDAAQEYQSNE